MGLVKSAYKEFLRTEEGVSSYAAYKKIVYGENDSLVEAICAEVLPYLPIKNGPPLSICDIGTGDGARITEILTCLRRGIDTAFAIDLIEQSPALLKEEKLSRLSELGNYQVHLDLFEDVVLEKRYDLLFLIHSIFAFPDEASIDKVLRLRSRDGILVVVGNACNSFVARLKVLVDKGYTDSRFEISDLETLLVVREIAYKKLPFSIRWSISEERFPRAVETIVHWLSLGRSREYSSSEWDAYARFFKQNSEFSHQIHFFQELEEVLLVLPA